MSNQNKSPEIVIAGAGSIGFYIGGLLHDAGKNVTFLARQRMIDYVGENGLHLTDYLGLDIHLTANELSMETSPDCLSKADIILVTVKSAATEEMAKLISQYANENTIVISLQNGLSNSALLKSELPDHQVLAGMVPFNVAQMKNARFHRGTSGNIVIEDTRNNLAKALSSKNLPFEASKEIENIQSGKLLLNLNNALNALSGLPLQEQLGNRGWRCLMADQIIEALAVMKIADMNPVPPSPVPAGLIPYILKLPTPLFKIIAKQMLSIDPYARSSMWADLEEGRKTEVNELQGEIIRLAEKYNLNAPLNYKVMARIKEAENKNQGSPNLKPEDI
jgi:2-dehydropantoate 2-reductase